MTIKVLIVIPSMRRVAPITIMHNICKFSDHNKIEYYIYSLDNIDTVKTYVEEFEFSCARVFIAKGTLLKALSDIKRICRNHTIDILHASGFRPNMLAWLTKRSGLPVKTMATIHSVEKIDFVMSKGLLKGSIACRLNAYLYSGFDAVCAVSEGVLESFKSYHPSNDVHLVYNGIDNKLYSPKPDEYRSFEVGKLIIGAAGKLVPIKGFMQLVEAANILINVMGLQKVEFYIAGDGNQRSLIKTKISSYGLENNFHLLGHIDDMNAFFHSIDLFVMTSKSEGLPLAGLEAMSCGIPIIGANVSGINEIVEHHKTGFLYEYGDVQDLADKIAALTTEPNRTKLLSLGCESRKRVANLFNAKTMAKTYELIYQECLENNE